MRGRLVVVVLVIAIASAGSVLSLALWGSSRSEKAGVLDVPGLGQVELVPREPDRFLGFQETRAFCDNLRRELSVELNVDRPVPVLEKTQVRTGVRLSLPTNLDLSPHVEDGPTQWYFSSGFEGGIDTTTGLRLSLGVFRSARDYPWRSDFPLSFRTPTATFSPTQDDIVSAFSFPDTVEIGGNCHLAGPEPDMPPSAVQLAVQSHSDDIFGPREFHQQALLVLTDGRLVVIALDGLPDVIPWASQIDVFRAIVESVSLAS